MPAALTLSSLAMYAVVALLPLLLDRGFPTTQAAWALGLGGAGQTSAASSPKPPGLR
ncbi:hypothetical protein [Streptomyces xantholiticus]